MSAVSRPPGRDATSSSTEGTSGSTGTTAGSSSGGGEVCPDLACPECFVCATMQAGDCDNEKAECAGDVDCTALADCVAGCPPVGDPGFEMCHDDRVDGMPGENLFKALGACLACDTCGCTANDHPEC